MGGESTTERGNDMGVKERGERERTTERQGHGGEGEWGERKNYREAR